MITINNINGTKNNHGVTLKVCKIVSWTDNICPGGCALCDVNPIMRKIIRVMEMEGTVVYNI